MPIIFLPAFLLDSEDNQQIRPHGLRSACSRLFCRNHNADFVDAHCTKHNNEIRLDGDARSVAYLSIDESPEAEQHLWHVRQIFLDENADGDFRIEADVNLDATQEEGEIIFKNYRVGFVEDLAE